MLETYEAVPKCSTMFQIAKENLRNLESASVPPLSEDEPLGPKRPQTTRID